MSTEIDRGPFVQLYSGTKWFPYSPRLADVRLADMAAALSRICRFGGHSLQFYSVAAHSLFVADMLKRDGHDAETQFFGLIHDAHEAYPPGDVPAPLKRTGAAVDGLNALESRAMDVVRRFFKAHVGTIKMSDYRGQERAQRWGVVKAYDLRALATERRELMAPSFDWGLKAEPFDGMCPQDYELRGAGQSWVYEVARLAKAIGCEPVATMARELL